MSADGSSHQSHTRPEPLPIAIWAGSARGVTDGPSPSCARCAAAIATTFYQIDGTVVCPDCRSALEHPLGSRLRRSSAAVGLGMLAAVGGGALYFAVAATTGREFGLVATIVGFLVGKAVRTGSRGRGGWGYQALAVSLTYLAIVSTNIPLIARDLQNLPARAARSAGERTRRETLSSTPNDHPVSASAASEPGAAQPAAEFPVTQAGNPIRRPSARPHIGFGTFVLGIGALLLLAAMAPIAAGSSNIMGLLIIGIAIGVAWMLNLRGTVQITGPYRVGTGASQADVRPEPA